VANIGVIFGVVFLAVEIDQNRQSLDQSNRLSVLDSRTSELQQFNEFRSLLAQSKELSEVWDKGINGKGLESAETLQFGHLCRNHLLISVTTYERNIELGRRSIAESSIGLRAKELGRRPGLMQCWEDNREMVRGLGHDDYVVALDSAVDVLQR
jgi:hypothetical protein